MALSKGIGMRFSELKDNHEPAPYWVWDRRDVRTYARYGVLPNGMSFGVANTPTQENSYARDVVIIAEDGEITACGWAFPDGGIGNHYPEPEVMLASPSAKTIVWLGGGELWVWQQDEELQLFILGCTKRIRIPGDAAVLDARMNENDKLDLWCEGGARHVYSCDGDVLVRDHHAAAVFVHDRLDLWIGRRNRRPGRRIDRAISPTGVWIKTRIDLNRAIPIRI